MFQKALLVIVTICCFSSSILADTLRVGSGPKADYQTIQEAVDTAAPGDTIKVGRGEYAGAIVNKPVFITGSGPDTRIVSGGSADPYSAFLIGPDADETQIRDLTIDGSENGVIIGINFFEADDLQLKNLEIVGARFSVHGFQSNRAEIKGLLIVDAQQGIASFYSDGWTIKDNILSDVKMPPSPFRTQADMVLLFGKGKGHLISNNTIYHHGICQSDEEYYTGIALIAYDGLIEHNVIRDNDVVMVVNDCWNGGSTAVLLWDIVGLVRVRDNKVIDNVLLGDPSFGPIVVDPSGLSDLNIIKDNK